MRRKGVKIALIVSMTLFIVLVSLYFIGSFSPKQAGILVESTPQSLVYLNGEQVGRTPYQAGLTPGTVVVRLEPDGLDVPSYETEVNLVSGIETVIKRQLGESEDESSGIVVSFEKASAKDTSIAVISIPDSSQVSIDGRVRGFTPYKTTSALPGDHEIIVSSPNYEDGRYLLKTVRGYKLTAIVKLLKIPQEELPKEEELKFEVEILETSTGFLRVRSEPSVLGEELFQVEPGEKYPFIEEDEESGWFKIEYEKESEGWVSNEFAKKEIASVIPSGEITN